MSILRNGLMVGLLLFAALADADDLVISQVYGGGGNSGAAWRHDFIEVFNRGASTVELHGWSVQYASAAGSNWSTTSLSGRLAPGQYLLVREGTGESGHGAPLPEPDVTGAIAMHASNGKVALVESTAQLSGVCPNGVVDLVLYGPGSCDATNEALDADTAAIRDDGGCADGESNGADFHTGTPAPRNRQSARHPCVSADEPPAIDPPPVLAKTRGDPPFTIELSGSDDHGVYSWSAVPGDGIAAVAVTGAHDQAEVTFTVTLASGFDGTATFTARLSDNANPPVEEEVNISVAPPAPHVVISQIYSAGGSAGALYRNDYVQLYNPGSASVSVAGWTLQYGSAASATWSSKQRLRDSIGPGQYYLIALAPGGAGDGQPLPPANVETQAINLGADAGKVALVRSDETLDGCDQADPALVDLVGYGSTGGCSEGNARAPHGSATLAIFRKDGGAADTNVNAADFETGAPHPFRDAPVVEHGPSVLSIAPLVNAPRDASITVTFSEPVEIAPGEWFRISCTASGIRGPADSTSAAVDAGVRRIVTSNAELLPGDRCVVTIFGSFVRDTDVDDSAPGTDVMAGNYTNDFSVADGEPPPYPPGVHLAMGNPSGAVDDPLQSSNYLMRKPEYALSYNSGRGTANWASWHLDDLWVSHSRRADSFRPDPAVRPPWYRVLNTDYSGSGFDRGHIVPSADRQLTLPINHATFLMSNMLPQAPDNNQGPWARLESYLRTLLPANELYIVAGGAGTGGTGDEGLAATVAEGQVTVPAMTWKVALVLPKADGDDVVRVEAGTRTIAAIVPNVQGIRSNGWEQYLVTVDRVEEETGYDFFSNVPDRIEEVIEAGRNGANPPAAFDQSVSTDEDQARSFTLDVVAPAGARDYVLASGTTRGTLGGSDADRTYTPAPDFNGTDRFTFFVTNSAGSSKTATVTITVLEVNDAPLPADDRLNAVKGRPLELAAAELTSNDAAGPANEFAQTLDVVSVANTGDTHGRVRLDAGTVVYEPEPGFSGEAAFAYTVCDNGVTRGLSAPLCATATVHVTVSARPKRRAVRS